jgi:hypothetical protein
MKLFAITALMIALTSTQSAAQGAQSPRKSHAVLYGTLLGVAAGVAGGALFFGGTNCHYGSDSGAAMVACGAITGGIVAGGVIAGHKIGHHIEDSAKARPAPAGTGQSSALAALGSMSVRLRAPREQVLPIFARVFAVAPERPAPNPRPAA